jgi:hypothetical protein
MPPVHFALVIFGDEGIENYLPGLAWTSVFLISASQVARIIGVRHWMKPVLLSLQMLPCFSCQLLLTVSPSLLNLQAWTQMQWFPNKCLFPLKCIFLPDASGSHL